MLLHASQQKRRLLLALSFLLIFGFLMTSLVSFFVSRASLRDQIRFKALPLTSDNVYSEIQRDLLQPVFISSLMANDTFFKDWIISGEKSSEKVANYLGEIKQQYGMFTSFFVSESSRIYYHANGILKKVKPDEARDAWYFRVREMEDDFEINVDPDLANKDAMTIFVNYKVKNGLGDFIGVAGVGLTINAVVALINSYSEKYDSQIYFTDQNGRIVLQGATFDINAHHIREPDCLGALADAVLSKEKYYFQFKRQGRQIHLNTRFVPELNWILFVEQAEDKATAPIHNALLVNLTICALITFVVLLMARRNVNVFQRFNQIQHDKLVENNAALALAVNEKSKALDRNQLLMTEIHHRVKNNLSIIQSLLRLQSARMEEGASRMALKESESRVRSIRNIHQLLSRGVDLAHLNATSYLNGLIRDVAEAFQTPRTAVQLDTEIEAVNLDMDQLIPIALILNELMTNAFKYAFEGRNHGEIRIIMRSTRSNKLELSVSDNGVGLPEDFDLSSQDSLGANILVLLSQQLDGALSCHSEPGNGANFTLAVPHADEPPEDR